MVEARRRGVAEDGCTAAALLSAGERLPARPAHATRCDLLVLMEAAKSAPRGWSGRCGASWTRSARRAAMKTRC